MQLSSWSKKLMDVLAWKLRATSATQLGRSSNIPRELVVRRLKRLKDMQLVELSQTAVHDWQLSGRLLAWPSDTWAVDMQKVPWQLEKRWDSLQCRRETVAWISSNGVRMFGGFGGRLRQRLQLQHDLGVAATYFSFSRKRRTRWVGEDHFRSEPDSRALRRLPDAVLRWSKRITAIEFGGRYDKNKLLRFDREMKRKGVRYEIY